MTNNLSAQLLAEMYAQESSDVFLMLATISHSSFPTIYLVNNTEKIVSRGIEYQGFPMLITLPADDGETERQAAIEFSNVSLELIDELRSVVTPMDIKIELILVSAPDQIQASFEDLKLHTVSYDKQRIKAQLYMDSFLNVELTSERYTPSIFRGLF